MIPRAAPSGPFRPLASLPMDSAPITLRPGQWITVALPDGQAVEIDARDPSAVVVHHLDSDGEGVALLEVTPEPDTDRHPSLTAAERNPSLR